MDGRSLDVTPENIARLRQLFPDVVSEGRVDFDRLRAALGAADALAPDGPDHYELRWAGKSAARREVQRPTTATLLPDAENSVDWDTTGHVFIEGENLEVLRVLQRGYFGKVKMIYIDPPYNTGSDAFVYPDDYGERREDYEKAIGQRDENGFLNKQDLWKKNTRESGQYHSAWLSMMWPRLYLSRNLLREDGVIFVSIDDNEVHNLRLLMNEVFGEENFVAELVWNLRSGTQAGHFTRSHEYVLCFAKSKEALTYFSDNKGGIIRHGALKIISKDNPLSQIIFPAGVEFEGKDGIFEGEIGGNEKQYIGGQMIFKNGKLANEVAISAGWAMKNQVLSWLAGKETFDSKGQRVNRFYFNSSGILWYEKERGTAHPKTVLDENVRAKTENTASVNELLGGKFFDYPKPVSLLKFLIDTITEPDSQDLILDFFAGSGTTAHAVLGLNEQDGGNRRFVLVQMPEPVEEKSEAFKAGYRTIADITRARLQKVSSKIAASRAGKLALNGPTPDLGFRAYRLDYSNFRAWRPDVTAAPDLLAQLELFQEPLRGAGGAADDGRAMLTELLLKMAGGPDVLPLSVPVLRRAVAGVEVHDVAGGLVWLALAGISPEVVAAAVAARPQRLVVPGRLFGGPNPDEQVSNARLQLADAGVVLQLI